MQEGKINIEQMVAWGQVFLEEYSTAVLWLVFAIVFLVGFIRIYCLIRDHNLIKSVTTFKRGTRSERDLVLRLRKRGISADEIFHDLYVEKPSGDFSQIDVVVMTEIGIIVFEVKEYSGWLFGTGNQRQWTQVLGYGREKYRIYNPILQNNNHIRALKNKLTGSEDIPIYSVVVFYGNCELKAVSYIPQGTYLVKSERVDEVLDILTKIGRPALYTGKWEIIDFLRYAVKVGENPEIQIQHINTINDMLGKNRIFD
ncbi:nuclease-related domain-containing protein [Mangrovibacterium lignilyticum]|uniref:nuclease-related domain-containing protein n=1 Tax=Mangrovibacterium lignilyticum TaxID=2668052 RepID=UPI0013D0058C|nr:nuclease-related domain-containing protein [Mangrovibacterium lignilyticum]